MSDVKTVFRHAGLVTLPVYVKDSVRILITMWQCGGKCVKCAHMNQEDHTEDEEDGRAENGKENEDIDNQVQIRDDYFDPDDYIALPSS